MVKKSGLWILGTGLILACISAPAAWGYEVNISDVSGELTGVIQFKGELSSNSRLKVNRNMEYCGATVEDESLIVNPESHGIKNVVVSLENVAFGKRHDPATIVVDNSKCRFVPRIQIAMVGDAYELKNSDPIIHNTMFHLNQDGFTLLSVALPPSVNSIKRPLIKNEGVINVKCNAHSFMRANILVFSHPYFAMTDENGNFDISNIPPGKYKIKIWHEAFSDQEREVTVVSNQKTTFSLSLSLKK
ncbi:MAG: carboxypeptidase-like regulatory domain-containing protein [Nitrospirae bacterium]|nr:carboxypeptidase-like regulatory domain-containing protein [Nitrospirota bacterium]